MPIRYQYSGSLQDDSDATWNSSTISYLTEVAAKAAWVTGDTIYRASDHQEAPGSSQIITSLGSWGDPCITLSVNRTTGVIESMLAAGGYYDLTGGTYDLEVSGVAIDIGGYYKVGDDFVINDENAHWHMINGQMAFTDTVRIGAGTSGLNSGLLFENMVVEAIGGIYFQLTGGSLIWRGGRLFFNGGSVDNNLFDFSTSRPAQLFACGVDFQDLDGGDYLVEMAGDGPYHESLIVGCKVPAALGGLLAGNIGGGQKRCEFRSVSNSDIMYQRQFNDYNGDVNDETSIYRTAGSTFDSVNISLKFATNANAIVGLQPVRYQIFEQKLSANPTFEVELNADLAAALTNADIWLEIHSPNTTTKALVDILTTKPATYLTTPTTLTASTEAWTGTDGFSNEQKRKITQAITGDSGMYQIFLCVAIPSVTLYSDLDVTVTY